MNQEKSMNESRLPSSAETVPSVRHLLIPPRVRHVHLAIFWDQQVISKKQSFKLWVWVTFLCVAKDSRHIS